MNPPSSPAEERPHPHRVSDLIPRKTLETCLARIETHRRLLETIRRLLPPPLAHHCRECVAGDGTLVLYAESAAWASQLRFYLPRIIEELAQEGHGQFRRGKVRTLSLAMEAPRAAPRRPAPHRPLPATIAAIDAAARASEGDIGTALARLCSTLRRLPR
ncbi:DUF721 domain-containing protein [Methylococcus capsulatus]|jgi:hypothetical protein|uniref:DUF721 domain-containing protein n=1 Tax=Methylococcus capsulatus (strain ATCC 33009 / NCIMB 11132 / Bath) TaxID=243233 RepID=Q604W5_METCA|nr:DUF721 domain-containing protein [Methylococcus capsulatus]AAU91496.1 conserved hypothetical protein [Methylococcus capsulatus str. Bath]QXP87004.1 DUF721 domain-containing protein [Methylococcus capsulatus]QXP93316.1 DUF721 domain-containing protein [Methylococcus capsulatus]UQN11986.1 DUF721 domain-containing protein [Methylococcus capsulatus]